LANRKFSLYNGSVSYSGGLGPRRLRRSCLEGEKEKPLSLKMHFNEIKKGPEWAYV